MKPEEFLHRIKEAVLYIIGKKDSLEPYPKPYMELEPEVVPEEVSVKEEVVPLEEEELMETDKPENLEDDCCFTDTTTITSSTTAKSIHLTGEEPIYQLNVDGDLLTNFYGLKHMSKPRNVVKVNNTELEIVQLMNLYNIPLTGEIGKDPYKNDINVAGWIDKIDEDGTIHIQFSRYKPPEIIDRDVYPNKSITLDVKRQDISITRVNNDIVSVEVDGKYFKDYISWVKDWPMLSTMIKIK